VSTFTLKIKKKTPPAVAQKNGNPQGVAVENNPPLRTKSDVSRQAKCSIRSVASWMASGKLPYVKLSPRMVRFLDRDVQAFLESRRISGGKS
jgi:hypothetical protein